jgi:hypothetical protein
VIENTFSYMPKAPSITLWTECADQAYDFKRGQEGQNRAGLEMVELNDSDGVFFYPADRDLGRVLVIKSIGESEIVVDQVYYPQYSITLPQPPRWMQYLDCYDEGGKMMGQCNKDRPLHCSGVRSEPVDIMRIVKKGNETLRTEMVTCYINSAIDWNPTHVGDVADVTQSIDSQLRACMSIPGHKEA